MPALADQVVVITGASSGIGRAAAQRFAAAGARVVAAARNTAALQSLAETIRQDGGDVRPVEVDVADWAQVQHLAQEAVDRYGRIDTWVNAAAVAIYARVVDTPVDEIRRLIEVNLLGEIHGMKAALPHLIRQGQGTIVNITSVEGERTLPLHSAYGASKHGIIGFSEALRVELARDHPGIKVVLILPASINTPFFRHAATHLGGKQAAPIPPVYDPRVVAEAVLAAAEHPQARIYAGSAAWMLARLNQISPALVDRLLLLNDLGFRLQEADAPDDGANNLFAPLPGPGAVRGAYGDHALPTSPYTRLVELNPAGKPLIAAALLAGLALLLRRR